MLFEIYEGHLEFSNINYMMNFFVFFSESLSLVLRQLQLLPLLCGLTKNFT